VLRRLVPESFPAYSSSSVAYCGRIGFDWVCFFQLRPAVYSHKALCGTGLRPCRYLSNWLCFFKSRHTIYDIRNTKLALFFQPCVESRPRAVIPHLMRNPVLRTPSFGPHTGRLAPFDYAQDKLVFSLLPFSFLLVPCLPCLSCPPVIRAQKTRLYNVTNMHVLNEHLQN
jgi:hypothetical protein